MARNYFGSHRARCGHILVDHARRHRAVRRSRKNPPAFGMEEIGVELRGDRLLALDEALDRLSATSER